MFILCHLVDSTGSLLAAKHESSGFIALPVEWLIRKKAHSGQYLDEKTPEPRLVQAFWLGGKAWVDDTDRATDYRAVEGSAVADMVEIV